MQLPKPQVDLEMIRRQYHQATKETDATAKRLSRGSKALLAR